MSTNGRAILCSIFNVRRKMLQRRLLQFFGFCLIVALLLRVPVSYISINEKHYHYLFVNKRVLFVTAHPDDEVMFFGPTINSIRRINGPKDIHLLAMTNGTFQIKWSGFLPADLKTSTHIFMSKQC